MQKDIRDTTLYREAESVYIKLRRPGVGEISDAAELHASPDGRRAVFAGSIVEKLEGGASTRICEIDLRSREIRVLTFGPNCDRLPKFSPDGRYIGFLSDRHAAGDFQFHVLDPLNSSVELTARVDGWVEYLHWSPDGSRVLLGVAGHGADISGGQGAVTSKRVSEDLPSWMPSIETGDETFRWRSVWVYEVRSGRVRQVSRPSSNVWEAVWCGNDLLAAVVSSGPGEGLWYSAHLHIIEVGTGSSRDVYTPQDQIGWPAASPSGKHLAIVEALCSDRWVVAGDLRIVETTAGKVHHIDTREIDITYTEWQSDQSLLLAGHRGFDTAVAIYDAVSKTCTEVWASRDISVGGRYVSVSGLSDTGDCVLVGESFVRAPEIAEIRQGRYRQLKSFDVGYAELATAIRDVKCVSWRAPDDLEIQGWLLLPRGEGPCPLVMNIHGGPVWHWRPTWLGRARSMPFLMLVRRGYAVFFPNPRGSAGRGQAFARKVKDDLNGADTFDYLSGVDSLVERQIADSRRVGVTGVSYGGNMTAWLITQDPRFAAAVPVAPHTNQITEYLISNIPHFVSLFMGGTYSDSAGKYLERSPVMHAHRVRTPTLNICGALDRCTPPEEAMQFHNALLENGVQSVLVTYPEEGHGVQSLPAAIDYAARVVAWFEEHMGATTELDNTANASPGFG